MSPPYKLTYFNTRGRAELIRLIFASKNITFTDERIESASWPSLKSNTPSGHLPILTFNGVVMCESMTIARFAANEAEIAGTTNLERAQADMIVEEVKKLEENLFYVYLANKDPQERARKIIEAARSVVPPVMKTLEGWIIKNNGGNGFAVGKAMTWADLALFNLMDFMKTMTPDAADQVLTVVPKLKALYDRVADMPYLNKYLKNRPEDQQ